MINFLKKLKRLIFSTFHPDHLSLGILVHYIIFIIIQTHIQNAKKMQKT
jgi:hypothetical protein